MRNIQPGRAFNIMLIIVAVVILGIAIKGIYNRQVRLKELKARSAILNEKISKVKQDIKSIRRQIEMAKKDPSFIRQEATNRYLIIGKDETLLIFDNSSSKNNSQ